MTPARRQRLLLITAATAIGLLALDHVAFTPLVEHWRKAETEINGLRQRIAAGEGSLQLADRTQARWTEMQAAALPAEVAQAEQVVLSHFNQWGREAGVDIGSVKPQWKRGSDPRYSTLECRIDSTGSLLAVTRFLHAIETSPLALRVDSVEFGSRDDRGQKIAAALVVSGLRLKPLETSRP